LLAALLLAGCDSVQGLPPQGQLGSLTEPERLSLALQAFVLLTVLSVAPAILLLMTSFTRIVVVLSLLRTALGTPQVPPNQVLLGLALFLTFFNMSPTVSAVNDRAVRPYLAGKISAAQALQEAEVPARQFMLRYAREKDIALFVRLSGQPRPRRPEELSLAVLIPAYVISELRTAFQMGVVVFVPFLVIDLVVASILMSMGMMMLPPSIVALPFKLLLFVMVDGWHLTVQSLMGTLM
jgi:flagellar biosynthetic protein FliP